MVDWVILNIYVSNISTIIIATLICMVLWIIIGVIFKRQMRAISSVVAVLLVLAILYVTVFSRAESFSVIELVPFSSFVRAVEQPEIWRSMFMNIVLFVPLGLTLPFVFRGNVSKCVLLTILSGFVLAITIEISQYIFVLGSVETDDVICNTIGAFVGSCAYPLSLYIRRFLEIIRK